MSSNFAVDEDCLQKLSLARHLLQLANRSLDSGDLLSVFAATNLLDDGVEVFLLGLSSHLKAPAVTQNTKFNDLIRNIEQALDKREVRNKQKLLDLHKLRNGTKHSALETTQRQVASLALAVEDTFEHETREIFGFSFRSFGVQDLLRNSEIKALVEMAHRHLQKEEYAEACICCRKTLFLEFEWRFSIEPRRSVLLPKPESLAPSFAQNPSYFAENVRDPIDYIVIEDATLDQHVLTLGANTATLKNLRRLTPAVYKCRDGLWAVRNSGLKPSKGDSQYVLDATCELLVAAERHRRKLREGRLGGVFEVTRKSSIELSPMYSKAHTSSSKVRANISVGDAEYSVRGLDGNEFYKIGFMVNHGSGEDYDPEWVDGFVLKDDFDEVPNAEE